VSISKEGGKTMKKSTELIKFFIKVAILAVAYSATGIFSEGEEVPFEIITLDETTSCMA
jgi:hypothetical protein